jgi:hypothetical protein
MAIFLILAPYGAFALLMLVTSAALALFASAAICLAVIALDLIRGRSVKILGAGSAVLFTVLGGYVTLVDSSLSVAAVKVSVDAGIFLISLVSMLIGYPFTLQYALEKVPGETAAMPGFVRANYIITGAWAAAALVMLVANMATIYVPGLPIWSSLVIAFAARNSAVYFTTWYPEHRRTKFGPHAVSAQARDRHCERSEAIQGSI